MNNNIKKLTELLDREKSLEKILSFKFDNSKLIADLAFGDDTYQIYTDIQSFLILFYDSFEHLSHYRYCESSKSLLQTLDDVVYYAYNGSLLGLFSNNWWSFLPEWILLKPNYLEEDFSDIFINEIITICDGININSDLSSDEKTLIKNWFDLKVFKYEFERKYS